MLRSMTGYGREVASTPDFDVTLEIKSVNNRYLDVNVRLPRLYGYLEEKIKKYISQSISRGKVDIYVSIDRKTTANQIIVDENTLDEYVKALKLIAEKYNLDDRLSLSNIIRFSDIFERKEKEDDADEVWKSILPILDSALLNYKEMCNIEGENLKNDLLLHLGTLEELVKKIDELAVEAIKQYQNRLETKIKEYLEDDRFDESRVLTEVAILTDKIATDEETARLKSHIAQFNQILNQNEPAGRKLDFLTQEINREINTIGSKCSMLEISKLVLDAKNEIEKIREQIQNVE